MKGYTVESGYMGYIPDANTYKLFPTEREYREYYRENFVDMETN